MTEKQKQNVASVAHQLALIYVQRTGELKEDSAPVAYANAYIKALEQIGAKLKELPFGPA